MTQDFCDLKCMKISPSYKQMSGSGIYKYLDIVSSSRVRSLWPNPSDFVVPVSFGANPASSAFQAQDPIVDGVPVEGTPLATQAGSTASDIVLAASSSTIINFYVDDYLQLGTEFQVIASYDPATQTATVKIPFTAAPAAGTTYYLRKAVPITSSTLSVVPAASSANLLNLGLATSDQEGAYVGQYVYFTSGPNIGVSMLIVQYTTHTPLGVPGPHLALLSKALPNTPGAADAFDILAYSRDNFSPLIYSGTIGFNQAICYSMELLYLTIPNQVLASGYGGTLDRYPFLYLYLYNEGNSHSDKVLYTNNAYAQSAMFKIPLGLNLKAETFFTLKDAKMINVCKFKPDQAMRFRLVLPDGEPIIFAIADNLSPLSPNPLLQISCTIAIRRIDGDGHK